ncbi:MAG TPA: TraB/GumN family protein [Novosphingobium sp.]|nr:TraB/GumN family protein [Novosphingobium sp.]
MKLIRRISSAPAFALAVVSGSLLALQPPMAAPLAAQTAPAQPAPAQPAPSHVAHKPKVKARPALWRLGKGQSRVYLLGTVHALPDNVVWMDGPVAVAFANSDTLVTEIIEKSPEEMRKIVTDKAMLPEGQSLRDMLDPKPRAAVEKALAANGLPANTLDRFKPWYAAVALSTIPLMHSGYDPANGVDARLSEMAKSLGRQHEALETAEYQLGLFDQLPIEAQKRYLNEVATGAPSIRRDLDRMIAAWKAGDAAGLARLMNEDENDPQLTRILLTDRNKAWAQWIRNRLDKPGIALVAVGAGHLSGPGSLLAQLRALGLNAVRVQ